MVLPVALVNAQSTDALLDGSSSQTIVICTGQGFARVTFDGDGNIIEQDNKAPGVAGTIDCPCFLPCGFTFIARSSPGFELFPPTYLKPRFIPADFSPSSRTTEKPGQARAPPALLS